MRRVLTHTHNYNTHTRTLHMHVHHQKVMKVIAFIAVANNKNAFNKQGNKNCHIQNKINRLKCKCQKSL